MQVLHQWRELIRDVLQRLGARSQRVQQLVVGIENLSRHYRGDGALRFSCQLGHVAAVVGGAKEEDRVSGDKYRVEMGDVLRGSAGGIDQCLREKDWVSILVGEVGLSDLVSFITRLTIMPPNEWQMKMMGLSEAPSICDQQGVCFSVFPLSSRLCKWQLAYTTIRFEIRHQCMRMLQDSIRRCASQQRRHVRVVAPGEDPGVADEFGQHVLVAEPGGLRIL